MELTNEQKLQHLWSENEIRKLMSRYIYYSYARTWELVPGMFAGRDDIWIDCEGFGIFEGAKGIETFFVDWHHSMEGDAEGIVTLHPLTTDIIEVAGDGKTARGLWISPGAKARRTAETNQLESYWIWGLYAIDFIKENGEWKFWHFRIPHLLLCDYHHSWTDLDQRVKMGSQIGNDGRPVADRPSTFEPTFYGGTKVTNPFFAPPPKHDTDSDLEGFWCK